GDPAGRGGEGGDRRGRKSDEPGGLRAGDARGAGPGATGGRGAGDRLVVAGGAGDGASGLLTRTPPPARMSAPRRRSGGAPSGAAPGRPAPRTTACPSRARPDGP